MQVITIIFSQIIQMAGTAMLVIPVVLAARLFLTNVSKRLCFLLWSIVALRLICPVMLPSAFALEEYADRPETYIAARQSAQSEGKAAHLMWYHCVWLAGTGVVLSYGLCSALLIKRRICTATRHSEGVYESEAVESPFIFGVIHPVIYIPYHLNNQELYYILQHERYHLLRRDYLMHTFCLRYIGFTRWYGFLTSCFKTIWRQAVTNMC